MATTFSYRVLTENESVEAANIDNDSVRNKWKAEWLSQRVSVKFKGKERSQLIGDSIAKIDVPGEAICKWCNRCIINYATNGKLGLQKHLATLKHAKQMDIHRTTPPVESMVTTEAIDVEQPVFSANNAVGDGGSASSETKSADVKFKRPVSMESRIINQQALVLAVVAEQSWSFTSVPVIIELAKALAADPEALSSLKMDRTTASYKMKFGLATTFTERTVAILRQTKFSLNIDEATASNTARVLALMVNFVVPATGCLATEHLASLSLVRVDSESVFNAVDKLFETHDIPWLNLIAILMDSCAVMRGSKAGFETLIRKRRAPWLLDIDGDVCHHIHNASKHFTQPFQHWVEGLFSDIHTEFHWASGNQDTLKEICFLLSTKFTTPQTFVAHRWLSVYDCAQATMVQLKPLTLYLFAFLSIEDKRLYGSYFNAICHDLSESAMTRLRQLLCDLKKRSRTDAGKKRVARLVDKLLVHRKWSKLIMGLYMGVLSVLKEYVCLFQSSACLVHQLHKEQLKLFKRFLAMFLEEEAYKGLTADGLSDPKIIDLGSEETCMALDEMFLGVTTDNELKTANEKLANKFRLAARSGFQACAKYLQGKLPLCNKVLQAMEVLDPAGSQCSTETKIILKDLPDLVRNMFVMEVGSEETEEEEEDEDAKLPPQDVALLTQYQNQVLDFSHSELPPVRKDVAVEKWWLSVPFDLLRQMATALLTCFHGPKVESAFSVMGNILDSKSSRMNVSTLSAIQTVKYSLKARQTTAVESFSRKDKLYSRVNRTLCKNMRGARGKRKIEQEAEQDRIEKERVALSLKKQKLVSKREAKAKLAEAEKTARIAHWRAVRSRNNARLQALSDALSLKGKPKDSAATITPRRSTSVVPHHAAVTDLPGRSRRPSHIAFAWKSWSCKVASSSSKKLQTPTPCTSAVPTASSSRLKTVPPITANGVSAGFLIPKLASTSTTKKKVKTPTRKRSFVPVREANVSPAPAEKRQAASADPTSASADPTPASADPTPASADPTSASADPTPASADPTPAKKRQAASADLTPAKKRQAASADPTPEKKRQAASADPTPAKKRQAASADPTPAKKRQAASADLRDYFSKVPRV